LRRWGCRWRGRAPSLRDDRRDQRGARAQGRLLRIITTAGFGDILSSRRTRPQLFGLTGEFEALIPRERRIEVGSAPTPTAKSCCRWTKATYAPRSTG
jgi:hypothetical protein